VALNRDDYPELTDEQWSAIIAENSANGIEDALTTRDMIGQSTSLLDRTLNEVLWAETFRSTIESSAWLTDRAFSPGRWAVGYPYLYVLYRVLNEIQPKRILELGLGQSTRMIAQYAGSHDGVQHIVVEHDQEWIDFFGRNFTLPDATDLLRLDWAFVSHDGVEGVRVYDGLADAVEGLTFDLLSIDGPLGGDMESFARIDVLRMLPQCLAPSFVMMVDDYERDAESCTVRAMERALEQAGVDFRACRYTGSKDLALLCSVDLAFLCSM
jgi:hypothetical protein